jgi:acetyl esterase/lipase
MNPTAAHIRHIEGPASWRSRALTTLLRVALNGRLRQGVDLLALRRHHVPLPHRHTHPEVSPLVADFNGLVPLLLQVSSNEMLCDEAICTTHKAHAAGVDVELELWPDMPHGFQVAPCIPESIRALRHIAAGVTARTGWILATAGTGGRAVAPIRPVAARSTQPDR